ncbi:hypothetical protein SISSUDRAFT_1054263 [Sistotremastrum suecicum HHB10207 ss-3]|uniref:Uncharacterized protein n=1 Tax=Sistotremastrum suecicum HHB10207 ss-3 TaxID=1314776 RepID=A0A165YNH8_9AGAM|nr:hypothetical protein SISSUDRAFT_1054263 [Sistotremastrum suecicum HHB10207 ss-3]
MSNDILADSLRELNKTMKKIQETLVDHGHKFDILTKDAVKGTSLMSALFARL